MKIASNIPPTAEVAACSRLAALVPVVVAGDTSTTRVLWYDCNRPIRLVNRFDIDLQFS
jgi:hypothetical protein